MDSKVSRLKELMVKSRDLAEPIHYFLDHIVNDDRFIEGSEIGDARRLSMILQMMAEQYFRCRMPVSEAAFLCFRSLWHGTCLLGDRLTQVMYFADIDVGIATMPAVAWGDKTELFRFSILDSPPSRPLTR